MVKKTSTKKVKTSKEKKPKKTSGSFKSYDEAKKVKDEATAALKEARLEFKQFLKDTGLKRGKNYSKDKKHGKPWNALNSKVEELEEQRKSAAAFMKEKKPKSDGPRATKYNYPDEIESIKDKDEKQLEMKKFRTKVRAAAKRAGVSVDEYLSDPAGYDEKAKASKPKKEKKEKKDKVDKKSKAKKEDTEEEEPKKKATKKAKTSKEKEEKPKKVKKLPKKKKAED